MRRKPKSLDHAVWFDGHKREYTYGYLCCVDSLGQCRIAHGAQPGSFNDISAYYQSDLYRNNEFYLGAAKMLVDGIFARIESGARSPFITPICYMMRPLTEAEARYNVIHAWDRSLVEHYFGRLKVLFPFIDDYSFSTESINNIFRSTLILTNIHIQQKPLRKN